MGYLKEIFLTALISMVPVIELRGGVPFGLAAGLDEKTALLSAVIGNLIVVPFVIIFARTLLRWLGSKNEWLRHWADRYEKKARERAKKIEKYELLGLYILVAIPLPGTGAWTGSVVAALLNLRVKRAFPVIALGVITAGLLMTFLSLSVIHAAGSI